MPVAWTQDEHDAVDAILIAHPVRSGRCFEAAQAILPIATGRDATARAWKIKPRSGRGRFVAPKVNFGERWFHHYTVEVEVHGVDAITGPDGTPWGAYLETHWQFTSELQRIQTDLAKED